MHRRSFMTALAGLATTALVPMTAEAAVWSFLGSKKISVYADYDELYVGAYSGLFRKLRFKFTGNDVVVHKIQVKFSNGETQNLAVNWFVPQGGLTNELDLRGTRRHIRELRFWYSHPANWRGKARVWAWGKH